MKAITLRQPWASLFVAGAKLIETRSWPTKHRGPLAVHASIKMNADEIALCWSQPFASALARLGFYSTADLPIGAVLGKVDLVDCLRMVAGRLVDVGDSDEFPIDDLRLSSNERAFGHYATGRFAWVTSPARFILDKPIPARGMLGLWELPDEIAARLA